MSEKIRAKQYFYEIEVFIDEADEERYIAELEELNDVKFYGGERSGNTVVWDVRVFEREIVHPKQGYYQLKNCWEAI